MLDKEQTDSRAASRANRSFYASFCGSEHRFSKGGYSAPFLGFPVDIAPAYPYDAPGFSSPFVVDDLLFFARSRNTRWLRMEGVYC